MPDNNKSLDDQVKEAELQRIKAEASRIESEKAKIDLEKAELERRFNLSWYRRPAFFQAVVAGLVAIPLIWFFVTNIVFPSLNTENIKLTYENEVKADSLRKAKRRYKAEIDSLNKEKAKQALRHLEELHQIKRQYFEIDSARKALAANYERLKQTQRLTQKERDEANKELAALRAQNKSQEKKLSRLESQIAQQELKTFTLQADIPVYLSEDDAFSMIKRKGYYDNVRNPKGRGIAHQYETKTLSGNRVVIDHATGLTWQQSGSSERMLFQDAKAYIDQLNREQFAGFNDWRLPTLEEAMSLMEPKRKNEDLYIEPVFDKIQQYIWTSDLYTASTAWYVCFLYGSGIGIINGSVRAVRSGH